LRISRALASKSLELYTIVNSINNDGIGQIVEFAAKNIDKIQTIAFQPVSFTVATKISLMRCARSGATHSPE
jgi:uncharacterized radical SAM superfamily Fe-S cluster-containing enzyme